MNMKRFILILLAGVLLTLNIYARSITTRDGKVFDSIRYIRHDGASLTFQHTAGIATISFTNLPNDIQNEYGYRPPSSYKSPLADKGHYVTALLIQVTDDGALAEIVGPKNKVSTKFNPSTGKLITITNKITGKWDQTVFLTGLPEKHVDGDRWKGMIYYLGNMDYTTVMGASRRVRHYTCNILEAVRAYSD
jgi:hypothetical protein